MTVAYDELLRRLFAARRAGVEWGTERVRALCDRLGAPDRRVGAIVHVGGTNGKGSTAAMIAAVAGAAGARGGGESSPPPSSPRGRGRVGGGVAGEGAGGAAGGGGGGGGGGAPALFSAGHPRARD